MVSARTVGSPSAFCGASRSTVRDRVSATALAISALRSGEGSVAAISTMTVSSGAVASIRSARSVGRTARSRSSMTGSSTAGVTASRAKEVTWFCVYVEPCTSSEAESPYCSEKKTLAPAR
jgi:hypothetical protein